MKSRLLFWVLVALIEILALADAVRYRAEWQVPQPLAPPLPDLSPVATETPPSSLKETLARPLFWEYRRPLPSTTRNDEKIPLARGELLALVTSENQRVALVAIPEQGVWRITEQSGPQGCRLAAVVENRAEFLCGAERITLTLMARPLPKPQNHAARPEQLQSTPQHPQVLPPRENGGRNSLEKPR